MNFEEYVADMKANSLDRPKRVKVLGRTRTELPHEPGTLAAGLVGGDAQTNNARAAESPTTGEVVGVDASTGEALVRQPGNRVVRVTAPGATSGNTITSEPNSQAPGKTFSTLRVAGKVSNNKSVSGTGWQPVEGRPGVSRLSGSSQRQIQGLDQLSDPCTPPETKLQLVLAEQAKGVGVTDRGVVGFTSSADGRVLANQASRDTQAYIDQLRAEIKAKRNSPTSLPQSISLESGTSTLGQSFSATQASLWKCADNQCVQAPDGFFASKEQCEQNCGHSTWSCVNGTCVEIGGSTGQHKSLADCVASNCGTRYTCIDGAPVPSKSGEFATLEAAIAGGCYWGYQCLGGECVPAIGGAFKSLACCVQSCTDSPTSWPVAITSATFDPPAPADKYRLVIMTAQNPGKITGDSNFYGDRGLAQYAACNVISIPENTTSLRVDMVSFSTVSNVEFARYEVYCSGVGFTDNYIDFYVTENNLLPAFADFTRIRWAQQIVDQDAPEIPIFAPRVDSFTGDGTVFTGGRVETEPVVGGVTAVTRNPALAGPYEPVVHENPSGGAWAGCS